MLIDIYLTVLPVSSLGATTKKVLNKFIHVISVISVQPVAYVGKTGKTKSEMNLRLILFKDEDRLFQVKTNCQGASAGFVRRKVLLLDLSLNYRPKSYSR